MGDGPGVGCVGPGSNRELAWGWKGIGMEFILLEAPCPEDSKLGCTDVGSTVRDQPYCGCC